MDSDKVITLFNENGEKLVETGAQQFCCIGAAPPFDHPHIYLTMEDGNVTCVYCQTNYKHTAELASNETRPLGCVFDIG